MQPLKVAEPIKINPELYKTNFIFIRNEDSLNNDPMSGVRGVNIEKQMQLNLEKMRTMSPSK